MMLYNFHVVFVYYTDVIIYLTENVIPNSINQLNLFQFINIHK